MFPITSYRISPNLLGITRWQAEIDGQLSRFARRAYTQRAAERKVAADEDALYDGEERLMQAIWLPLTMPLRRFHDRLCQGADRRRRAAANSAVVRTSRYRLTPRGLLAFWRCYRMQWRHLRRSHGTRRSAAHTARYYGPVR